MSLDRASHHIVVGVSTLLFVASAAVTIVWCQSMSAMGEMPMPGGWTMSMMWMRMPGQTWPGVGASFLSMWIVMMVAMMVPSLIPMLLRYRENVERSRWLTPLVGMGYFSVWTVVGVVVFPIGVAITAVAMRESALARVVPITVGAVVVIAGLLQLSKWKVRRLACCWQARGRGGADARAAWRHGVQMGIDCVHCCGALMAIPLVMGLMDLRVMAVVAAAITAERLSPDGTRVARAIGAVGVGAGLFMIALAAALV